MLFRRLGESPTFRECFHQRAELLFCIDVCNLIADYTFFCSTCEGDENSFLDACGTCNHEDHEQEPCYCEFEYQLAQQRVDKENEFRRGEAFVHICAIRNVLCEKCAFVCESGSFFHRDCAPNPWWDDHTPCDCKDCRADNKFRKFERMFQKSTLQPFSEHQPSSSFPSPLGQQGSGLDLQLLTQRRILCHPNVDSLLLCTHSLWFLVASNDRMWRLLRSDDPYYGSSRKRREGMFDGFHNVFAMAGIHKEDHVIWIEILESFTRGYNFGLLTMKKLSSHFNRPVFPKRIPSDSEGYWIKQASFLASQVMLQPRVAHEMHGKWPKRLRMAVRSRLKTLNKEVIK
jgi:hypothetical protein